MNKQIEIKLREKFLSLNTWEAFIDLFEFYDEFIIQQKSNIQKKDIAFVLFSKVKKYKEYKIPKKKLGEFRIIESPKKKLKTIQKIFQVCIETCFTPKQAVHGFVKERSIVTNAKHHIGRKYVYNIDLKDFFPTIHYGRVKGLFQSAPFNFSADISQHLANICCNDAGTLPQGAPTSPIISNLVCRTLDRKLSELAKKNKIKYTRYADDITFSSNSNIFNDEFFNLVNNIVGQERFSINLDKVRLQNQLQRQEVTGITVNKKTNVTRKYMNDLRFLIKIYKNNAFDAQRWLELNYTNRHRYNGKVPNIQEVIQGKLDFLKMVVGEDREKYKIINEKFKISKNEINVEHINIEKIIIEIKTLIEDFKTTTDEDGFVELLLKTKMFLCENSEIELKELSILIKTFEENKNNIKNKFSPKNFLSEFIENPIELIHEHINNEIIPIENGNRSSNATPLYLIFELEKFRSRSHSFGRLMHSSNERCCDIVSEAINDLQIVGKTKTKNGIRKEIPLEIYRALNTFSNMLKYRLDNYEYLNDPYLEFHKNNQDLLQGFKSCFRFDTGVNDFKMSNVVRYAFNKVLRDNSDIWYLNIQYDIDEIFKNILTSTKNIAFAIEKIFYTCSKHSSIGAIKLEATRWCNLVILRIVNLGIYNTDREPSMFLRDIGADMKMLQSLLDGYCELNIRSTFKNEQNNKICLIPYSSIPFPSETYIPKGFTFELIFYKPIKFLLIDDGDENTRLQKAKNIIINNPQLKDLLVADNNLNKEYKYLQDYNAIFIHISNPEYEEISKKLLSFKIPFIAFSGEKYYAKVSPKEFHLNDVQFYDNLENYLLQVVDRAELFFNFWEDHLSDVKVSKSVESIDEFINGIYHLIKDGKYSIDVETKIKDFIGYEINIPFLSPKNLKKFIKSKIIK